MITGNDNIRKAGEYLVDDSGGEVQKVQNIQEVQEGLIV